MIPSLKPEKLQDILILLRVNYALKELLHKAEVDRAVFFGLLYKIWGIASGPITALLIATRFTPELQGYYYTFANLLTLQVFVELGLGTVIIQFASHEWSKLNIDKDGYIVGDKDSLSRLVSLSNITFKWYFVGSIIVIFGLGIGGYIFFSQSHSLTINWVLPWVLLCLLTGVTICFVPAWSLLEGCNQVKKVYIYRFWQGLFTSLSVWIAILLGAGLWAATVLSIVTIICSIVFIKFNYWKFFKTLLSSRAAGPRISWHKDILSMQWRIALSWISGYFVFSFFTPVLFKYHGPAIAGQMGLTWSVVGVIGVISTSWLTPKVPQFGMLIAQKKYKELDAIFWRVTKIVVMISIFIGLGIWFFVCILYSMNLSIAKRILPPLPTGLFILAQIIVYSSVPFSSYMRAHKQEPVMFLSILSGILIGLSTLILGKYYAATGMAVGYLIVNIIIIPFVFILWYHYKVLWHSDKGI